MRYILFGFILFFSRDFYAQGDPVALEEVKAVFLYNFVGFTQWPPTAFSGPEDTLIVAVLGENPFSNHLKETVYNEKKGSHPIQVRYYSNINEVKDCHVLFINEDRSEHLERIFLNLKGKNILTVGDSRDFLKKGGMIRFYIDDNKVRFQINMLAVKSENIEISSKLLRLASIVNLDIR